MLDRIKDLPPGVVGLSAVGKLSREDYDRVFEPLLEGARREGRRLRFLYRFGPDFHGFTPGAAWEDARLGLRSMRVFEGCAVVSDVDWIRGAVRLARFMMPCPVRAFSNDEFDSAVEWLRSLSEAPGSPHRLFPEKGVILLDVKGALRREDFDALEQTADSWIEAHGYLRGVVIHAREFPGWENLDSFLRHVRFVRDHNRNVRKIGLALDSRLANVAPRIAELFVHADVKRFAYDDVDKAVEWAGR